MTRKIERFLYARGYHVPEVRKMMLQQVMVLLCGMVGVVFGAKGMAFAAGVLLGTINFLALGRLIQDLVFLRKGAVAVQMFSFYGRLVLTAFALYFLVIMRGASIPWLLLGLSTVLVNILLWGMSQFLGKTSKEA